MYDIYQQSVLGVKKCKVNIDSGVISAYIGIRSIPLYNIKIHIHIKITIYKHNNT